MKRKNTTSQDSTKEMFRYRWIYRNRGKFFRYYKTKRSRWIFWISKQFLNLL